MKKPYISPLATALIAGAVAVWWAIAVVLGELLGEPGVLIAQAVALLAVVIALVEILLRLVDLRKRGVNDERQQQALFGLYTALKPRAPLPVLRTAAISPDTALEYVRLIRQLRPATVVELGSGVSTVLSALQLRDNGSGRVIAVDDDAAWARRTRIELEEHGVQDWAEVRHAVLRPTEVEEDTVPWYDRDKLADIDRIDLLLIDGPKDYRDRGHRRPGLTHLVDRLGEDAVVFVDDGIRARWRHWVYAWAKENGFLVEEPFLNEKRSMILYREESALARAIRG